MKYEVIERRDLKEDPGIILTTDDLGHAKTCLFLRQTANNKKKLNYQLSIRRVKEDESSSGM